ncbi:hypothetical protein BDR26DRAFT_874788, partial [Obelidium mucronatum]
MTSLSVVSQVRRLLSAAMDLANEKEHFKANRPEFDPISMAVSLDDSTSVLNDLQIPLVTTPDLHGVTFGLDFFNSFERVLNEHFVEIVSEQASEFVQVHVNQLEFCEDGGYEVKETTTFSGAIEFEHYLEGFITEVKEFSVTDFTSQTKSGTGNFNCCFFTDGYYIPVTATAVDYKVTKLVFTRPPN